jgi:hypothetical protein
LYYKIKFALFGYRVAFAHSSSTIFFSMTSLPDLVPVPAGSFRMGALNNGADCDRGVTHGLAGKSYGWP